MYNKYVDGTFAPLQHSSTQKKTASSAAPQGSGLLGDVASGISGLLGRLGKQFSIADFDAGDILLILIILLLFLEGDNLETVITLGLMLLLG